MYGSIYLQPQHREIEAGSWLSLRPPHIELQDAPDKNRIEGQIRIENSFGDSVSEVMTFSLMLWHLQLDFILFRNAVLVYTLVLFICLEMNSFYNSQPCQGSNYPSTSASEVARTIAEALYDILFLILCHAED